MREAWWVDVLEGEYNQQQYGGVELLSKHSQTDELIISNLRNIKNILKQQIAEDLPEDEAFYRRLHANVMDNVIKYEEQKKLEQKKKTQQNKMQIAKIKTAKYYFSMGM